jgi:Transposase DDE domain
VPLAVAQDSVFIASVMYQSESLANNQKDSFNLKAKCTTSDHGRVLYCHFDEDFYDRMRRYQGTEPYEKALRKRAVWVESLFGEAKDWHGMRRFRLRRLGKVTIEALLIASGQHVKRLLAFGGRRPKKLAQVAALRPPSGTGHEMGLTRRYLARRSWRRPTRVFFQAGPFSRHSPLYSK